MPRTETMPISHHNEANVFFLAAPRSVSSDAKGSLVDYESSKIRRTTMSTTVAELYALMKCCGNCLFLRGLWMDLTSEIVPIHIRTDAANLVTTARTTHLPEQEETVHMIQMLRKEACSGMMDDLAHVRTAVCLSDSLTKQRAKPDALVKALETGVLPQVDLQPPFRAGLQHRAYTASAASDHWRQEGDVLIRVHVRPRRCLFVPQRDKLPQFFTLCNLYPTRVTSGQTMNGHKFEACDSWIVVGAERKQEDVDRRDEV